jgi:acetyl-CoA acetyltransferase family protein
MAEFKPYNAYIVECVRSAGGKKNGKLSGWHPTDMCAAVIDDLVARTGIDGANVDDVIVGCVSQVGAQSGNIGRNIVMSCKNLPETVPGTAVDRQCGSGQQALHFACQAVMSGTQDCVIAAGVENMSQVPIGANVVDGFRAGHGLPNGGKEILNNYGDAMKTLEQFGMDPRQFSQFGGAELLAKKYNMTKEDLDKFSVLSQQRGADATKSGRFDAEIVPLQTRILKQKKDSKEMEIVVTDEMHTKDEGIRASTYEKTASLKPMFKNGIITPATSSQICDGAAAVMVCNEDGLKKLGINPRAKITALSVVGADPVIMLEGPVPATGAALKKSGIKPEEIDVIEVNEAFAPVPIAVAKTFFGGSLEKINVNGGAMALGHPLGGTGVKLMTTLVHELEKRQGRYGLLAICEGGGTANATIIERIPQSKL